MAVEFYFLCKEMATFQAYSSNYFILITLVNTGKKKKTTLDKLR